MPHTFAKAERLNKKKIIGKMFKSGSRSFAIFPLRVVYLEAADDEPLEAPVSVMISVSKRSFKHAVDRNRVKRQIREAYRLNKASLTDYVGSHGKKLAVAFIYLTDRLLDSTFLAVRIKTALAQLQERLEAEEAAG